MRFPRRIGDDGKLGLRVQFVGGPWDGDYGDFTKTDEINLLRELPMSSQSLWYSGADPCQTKATLVTDRYIRVSEQQALFVRSNEQ